MSLGEEEFENLVDMFIKRVRTQWARSEDSSPERAEWIVKGAAEELAATLKNREKLRANKDTGDFKFIRATSAGSRLPAMKGKKKR